MSPHKFKSWFVSKLQIGGLPGVRRDWGLKGIKYIINVSDEFYKEEVPGYGEIQYHWFPMSEQKRDIGLNSIYGALVILSHAEKEGAGVYLHCHSGSNRSWTVAAAYYYYRTGTHLDRPTRSGHLNKLVKNCDNGYLPPRREMEAWLNAIRDDFRDGKMKADILSLSKINTLVNF